MQHTLQYRDITINIIIKPNLKHSYLKIIDIDTLQINTPINSEKFIKKFIDTKYLWILKHIKSTKIKQLPTVTPGKNILLLGKLEAITADIFTNLYKKLQQNQSKQLFESLYIKYYKSAAKIYLPQRAIFFSTQMKLIPKKILYRKMKRRLGSCNFKQEITFNILIMKLPPHLIDYVIVHELAHLRYMNHSKDFHLLVQTYLPNAKYLKKEIQNIINFP